MSLLATVLSLLSLCPLSTTERRAAVVVPADTTIVDSVAVGRILIRVLPDSIDAVRIVRYDPLRVPATGWFYDRSFFWRTEQRHSGTHPFLFLATREDGRVDSVTVRISVVDDGG